MWLQRFASNQNFLDPSLTKDGKPYGPIRYDEIIHECYLISKHIHTSYNDLLDITPTEREALLRHITEDIKRQNEAIEAAKKKKIK